MLDRLKDAQNGERIREAEEAERREREAQEEAIRAAEAARIAEEERIEAEKAEMQRLQDLKDSAAPLYPQAPQQPLYGVATPVPKQAVAKAVAKPTETESLFSKPDDETKETSASTPAPSQSDSAPEVPTVVGEFNETVVMDDDNTVDEAGQSDTENTVKTESGALSPLFVNKNEDEEEDKEEYADMPLLQQTKRSKPNGSRRYGSF